MNLTESKWIPDHGLAGAAIESSNGKACFSDLHQVGSNKWVILQARDKRGAKYGTAVRYRLNVTTGNTATSGNTQAISQIW